MRSSSVYILRREIVLLSFSSDQDTWIWKATKPFYRLSKLFDKELIVKIRDVLSHSKEKIEFESDYSPNKEMELSIGLRFKQLQVGGVDCVEVSEQQGIIDFLPTRNLGNNKGFSHLNDKKVSVPTTASDEDVLSALKEAISRCEQDD